MKSKWVSIKKKEPIKQFGTYLVLTRLGNPLHLAVYHDGFFAPYYEVLDWKTEEEKGKRHRLFLKANFHNRILYWMEIPEYEYNMRYPKK